MPTILSGPLLGLLMTIAAYDIGIRIQRRWPSPLLNPIITASGLVALFLLLARIPYETYQIGGSIIHFFLGPLTVSLALPLYRQRDRIRRYFKALMVGIVVSVIASAGSVALFSRLFRFDEVIFLSLLPKSLTNPIAAAVSEVIGGNPPMTVAFVILTGITGVLAAPLVFTLLGIWHPIARGTALGAASHALGTARAFEYGETEGSLSSVAIGLTGLITTLLMPILLRLLVS
jgi:predicted murein hydrolase (TIGR00659 family)